MTNFCERAAAGAASTSSPFDTDAPRGPAECAENVWEQEPVNSLPSLGKGRSDRESDPGRDQATGRMIPTRRACARRPSLFKGRKHAFLLALFAPRGKVFSLARSLSSPACGGGAERALASEAEGATHPSTSSG